MNPYIKQIVELHKIHKAIENCSDDNVNPTPQPEQESLYLPYQPTKIIGVFDYNSAGVNINYNDSTIEINDNVPILTTKDEIIDYVKENSTGMNDIVNFGIIIEYYDSYMENQDMTKTAIKGGVVPVGMYYNSYINMVIIDNRNIGGRRAIHCKWEKDGKTYLVCVLEAGGD